MPMVTKPRVETVSPVELASRAQAGKIRIPPFQRPFRWEVVDVVQLFDSILRGYPVGNLLMWQRPAPAGLVTLGSLHVHAPETMDAWWIVDGQQRVASLVGALTATEETADRRYRIYYDIHARKFLPADRRSQVPSRWLPVSVARDNKELIAWQRARKWLDDDDFELSDAVMTAIREYEIPVYVVEGDDESVLREIFDRLNTFGKRLKSSEVFQALHTVSDSRQPSDLQALLHNARQLGFGDFTEQSLLQSVMAARGGNVDRDFRAEFTSDTDRHQAFRETERALGHVVEYLQGQAGIPHVKLLPYSLVVPVLVRYVVLFGPPSGLGAELLRRWIWRGAIVGVAAQGNTASLRKNASAVEHDPVRSVERLIELLPAPNASWRPALEHVSLNRTQAKVNALGLASTPPLLLSSREDGEATSEAGDRDRPVDVARLLGEGDGIFQHIVPRDRHQGTSTRSLANLIVHPAPERGSVLELMLSGTPDDRQLASHCIDEEGLRLLRTKRFQDFLDRRSAAVTDQIMRHVQEQALWGFRDGPDLSRLFAEDDGEEDRGVA